MEHTKNPFLTYSNMNCRIAFYAESRKQRSSYYATILQPNLSPPARLRQKSERKTRLFLSGDDKNEHLFGFRDQKVAGSNPVTSTKKLVGLLKLANYFLCNDLQKQGKCVNFGKTYRTKPDIDLTFTFSDATGLQRTFLSYFVWPCPGFLVFPGCKQDIPGH